MIYKMYPSILLLENGMYCQGWSFTNCIFSKGELVFNTGMTGYQEIITDPSYCGQIILFTYPEIGNTGINIEDMESAKSHIKGLVVKSFCLIPSNWRNSISLVKYLIDFNIPHIFGIDTRYLAKYLRNQGVMTACISSNPLISNKLRFTEIFKTEISDVIHPIYEASTHVPYRSISDISVRSSYSLSEKLNGSMKLHVVIIDFGLKYSILKCLRDYGCDITVVSADSSYYNIMNKKPDGILLSNGPGDPSLLVYIRHTIQKLLKTNIPIFGICLGHQLLSLALGGQTEKLKFGHRGLNHPSGLYNKVCMTSQNHGFVVSPNTLCSSIVNITYSNLNDNTIAGLVHNKIPCLSVQYHPEASPGPHDSRYLFFHFVEMMVLTKLSLI